MKSVLFLSIFAATASALGVTPRPSEASDFINAFTESSGIKRAFINHAEIMASNPFPGLHHHFSALQSSSNTISADCLAAGKAWNENHKATCDAAFNFANQSLSPEARAAALCGEDKCLSNLRSFIVACRAEIKKIDPSGGLEFGAQTLNAFSAFCPDPASTTDKVGCFASFATYGERLGKLNFENNNIPSNADLEAVCGDKCVNKIQQYLLSAARRAGAKAEEILTAEAFIKGQEILCLRRTDGQLCYSDFRAATDKGLQPEKICTTPCVRRGFKLLIDLMYATNKNLSKDYGAIINLLCKQNESNKLCYRFLAPEDEGVCSDMLAKVTKCGQDVEAADETCKGKLIVDGSLKPTQDASCACLDKVVACEIATIDASCLKDFYGGCQTAVREDCKAATCAPFKQFTDPCESVAQTGSTCTAECKASAEKSIADWGCCLGEIYSTVNKVNPAGELKGMKAFNNMIDIVQAKCELDKALLSNTCPARGKVSGKAVLRGLAKSVVDKDPTRFYDKFADDLSDNSGVAKDSIKVTGHEEVMVAARKIMAMQASSSSSSSAGVAFQYEISTDNAQEADQVKGTLDTEIKDGSFDMPALQSEVAKDDPGAQISVDRSASQTTAVNLEATATPDSSSASTVAVSSSFAIVSLVSILLAFA